MQYKASLLQEKQVVLGYMVPVARNNHWPDPTKQVT